MDLKQKYLVMGFIFSFVACGCSICSLKIAGTELQPSSYLAKGDRVRIYTFDKRIIAMKVLEANDTKVKGRVLVLDGKKTEGLELEVRRNEINKLICGERKTTAEKQNEEAWSWGIFYLLLFAG